MPQENTPEKTSKFVMQFLVNKTSRLSIVKVRNLCKTDEFFALTTTEMNKLAKKRGYKLSQGRKYFSLKLIRTPEVENSIGDKYLKLIIKTLDEMGEENTVGGMGGYESGWNEATFRLDNVLDEYYREMRALGGSNGV